MNHILFFFNIIPQRRYIVVEGLRGVVLFCVAIETGTFDFVQQAWARKQIFPHVYLFSQFLFYIIFFGATRALVLEIRGSHRHTKLGIKA